jgi:hypothetical protein
MRILFIQPDSDLYGSSRSLCRLLQSLPKPFVPIVLLMEDGPLRRLIEERGVEVILFPQLSCISGRIMNWRRIVPFLAKLPRSIFQLRRIIKDNAIDLVHTNWLRSWRKSRTSGISVSGSRSFQFYGGFTPGILSGRQTQ